MIFHKVPVGMRKTATLTMEKNVRRGTMVKIKSHIPLFYCCSCSEYTCVKMWYNCLCLSGNTKVINYMQLSTHIQGGHYF